MKSAFNSLRTYILKTVTSLAIFCTLLFFFSGSNAFCANVTSLSLEPSTNTLAPAEEFELFVFVNSPKDINISACRITVNFDSSKFKYNSIFSGLGASNFKTYLSGNTLTIIYLTSELGASIFANSPFNFLDISFKALSDIAPSNTDILAKIDGVVDYNASGVEFSGSANTDLNLTQVPAFDCTLSSLSAEGYPIKPNFDKNINKYSVEVPPSKNKLTLSATATDPDAKIKVSRETLNAAGKTTDITITVTGADNKSKRTYVVTVGRGVSAAAEKPGSSSSSKSDGGSSSGSATSTNLGAGKDGTLKSNLVQRKSTFNFVLFLIVSLIAVGVSVYLIKKKKT